MAFVAALRHPSSTMFKTTFLCGPCNRTWTYVLAPQMAERYQRGPPAEEPEREIVWV